MRTLLVWALAACGPPSAPPAAAVDDAPVATEQEDPVDVSALWNFQDPAGSEHAS